MQTVKLFSFLALIIGFCSCNSDLIIDPILDLESKKISNLEAPQEGGINQTTGQPLPISGEFTKFSFSSGEITDSETDWDIAFRGLSIIVNGGSSSETIDEPERSGNGAAYLASGTMGSINDVDISLLEEDSGNGYVLSDWYTYSGPPSHLITPTAGKILVIRTNDDRYAKVEILSYYKDAPSNPDPFANEARYYTFNYVYQPNEGQTSFNQ